MKSWFTPREALRATGVSYRMLQYWDRTRFIQPSYRRRGKFRVYTFADMLRLRTAKVLRSKTVSIQKLRKVIRSLDKLISQVNVPLYEVTLVFTGVDLLIITGQVVADDQTKQDWILISARAFYDELRSMFDEPAAEDAAAQTEAAIG